MRSDPTHEHEGGVRPVDPVDRMAPKARWAYELIMVTLAVAVIVLLTLPNRGWIRVANLTVWALFVIDYGVRLAGSGDRRTFVRTRVADLIAILPADAFRVARLARLARLVRLLRSWAVLWRSSRHIRGILQTNGLGWVLALSAGLVVAGGMAAWTVEPQIDTIVDGLWWSLVTVTTVGYGDISPQSGLGRVVAAVLMIVGIGAVGLLTATFATYFIVDHRADQHPHIEFVRSELERWDALSPWERRNLAEFLLTLCEDGGRTGQHSTRR
jgi:voltage-gated potassium channel